MEVHNIIISGIIFHVEAEGVHLLNTYLTPLQNNNIHRDFEFESNIAEFLLFKLRNGNTNTTVQDVQHLIKFLGPVPQRQTNESRKPGGNLKMKKELFPFIRLFNNKPANARINLQLA